MEDCVATRPFKSCFTCRLNSITAAPACSLSVCLSSGSQRNSINHSLCVCVSCPPPASCVSLRPSLSLSLSLPLSLSVSLGLTSSMFLTAPLALSLFSIQRPFSSLCYWVLVHLAPSLSVSLAVFLPISPHPPPPRQPWEGEGGLCQVTLAAGNRDIWLAYCNPGVRHMPVCWL